MDGTAVRKYGRTETLYLMPSSNMFPLGITSATIGICEGLLHHANEYQRTNQPDRGPDEDDPYTMYAVGEATAQLRAARDSLLANVDRMWDLWKPAGPDVRAAREGEAYPGQRGLAGRHGDGPGLRPLRAENAPAHGQADAALLRDPMRACITAFTCPEPPSTQPRWRTSEWTRRARSE